MADISDNQQQREFVRVDDILPFSWRRCSEEELAQVISYFEKHRAFPPREQGLDSMLASLDISDKLVQLERQDPIMARVLGKLDVKLNLLLRLFNPDKNERPLVPTPVNVSGGGIAFMDKEPAVARGDVLDIRVAFSLDAVASIRCYARVMRVFDANSEGLNRVATKFEPIMDQDREQVIQYVFRRQTEMLRAKRSGKG
ncbi:MAG: PilZ domain-containing protein, partial [Magnetococcales bacterium]|nr:PilZ domain-containing protein [Magnetococcales bacterium]